MPLSDFEVEAMVGSQKADAMAAMSSAYLTQERAKAMDYYRGVMDIDMPHEEGRSGAVSTDVSDTVLGLMPHLMDIFAGTDEVVKFEPVGPEDEEAAQQETDYCNHVFMQQNDGFMVLYNFLFDALLSKTGIVKVWWEKRELEQKETYEGLTDDQFALLSFQIQTSDGKYEILEHSEEPSTNPMLPGNIHSVVVKSTKKLAQAKVFGVPPEEFGIERQARNIKDCNYCYHQVVTKTQSQLIDEGFDEEDIKSITEYTGISEIETIERDTVVEHLAITGTDSPNPASRLVMITEHYIRMDYEDNGRPKLYQVITGGDMGKLLRKKDDKGKMKPCVEEWDQVPFAVTTAVPQPHRFFGRSIADLVMPIQREKTAIKRGILDNIYLRVAPRVEVAEANAGPNTIDDLLVVRPGGLVRTKTPGGLNWQEVPDVTQSAYPLLQYLDADLETRTGLAKQTQGIDANALQNQSATAVAQVFSASQMRIKLIARIMAEGVRDIFSLLHGTIRKHGEEAATVRLRNRWVSVDPRNWKTRDDMTINVGLGTGGKAQQFAQVMALANVQKEMLMGGKANLVDDTALFNTASEMTKIMGYKNPDRFFNDPTAKDPQTGQLLHPPVPPPPDPKLQLEAMKQQGEQNKMLIDAHQNAQKMQVDAYHNSIKAQTDAALAQFKAELDAKLKIIEAHYDANSEHQKMVHAERKHGLDIAKSVMDMHQNNQAHNQKMEEDGAKDKKDVLQNFMDMHEKHRQSQEKQTKMMAEAIKDMAKELNKPKRIVRGKDGRASHTETVQ